jgi:hypothetical protein
MAGASVLCWRIGGVMVGELLGGAMVLIGVVLLFFLRPITASHDSPRTDISSSAVDRKRLQVESGRRLLLVCVMLILGGAALVIAAV